MKTKDSSFSEDPITRYVSSREFKMLVGGEFVGASDGSTLSVGNPSTGDIIASVPCATRVDIDRSVASAKMAQPAWEDLGLDGRTKCFEHLGLLIRQYSEEFAMLDAIDSGNPIRAMRTDVEIALKYLDVYPKMAYGVDEKMSAISADGFHYTASSPYGVVGRITAFNHPFMFAVTRPLPALIMGNTVVMKVAPQTPLSALALAELFAEAFPPGTINVLSGGSETGDALTTHPAVKRLAFTGSVETGLTIQRRAAESGYVKQVSLELGGKNAMVVFSDVDLDAAVEGALTGMSLTVCQGQACGSNSRILVHRSIYEEFLGRLADRLSTLRVGVAYSEESDMGPLISEAHRQRVVGYIAKGRAEGAMIVNERERSLTTPDHGYFVAPVLFSEVRPDMVIAQEEIFGPVISVIPWEDYGKMIDIANGTQFGLTASVWTHDLDLAHRTAVDLDAGYIWINDSATHYIGTPFGGTKNSGVGREENEEELRSYLETKVVHARLQMADASMRRRTTLG